MDWEAAPLNLPTNVTVDEDSFSLPVNETEEFYFPVFAAPSPPQFDALEWLFEAPSPAQMDPEQWLSQAPSPAQMEPEELRFQPPSPAQMDPEELRKAPNLGRRMKESSQKNLGVTAVQFRRTMKVLTKNSERPSAKTR